MFPLPFSQDLFQQPTLPASTANYAQLVHDSTTQLQQSLECIVSALNRRSMALSKCAKFDAALRDANAMQQLSPSSALGYLRAAEVYSAQGIQRRVVDICNNGLRMANTKDTHYATLQQAKEDAMHQSNKRVDFVTQLPFDIVATVLLPMFIDRNPLNQSIPLRYLCVSDNWYDRIIQYLDGLRFTSELEYKNNNAAWCSLVQVFAQDVRSLVISQYSHGTWLSDLLRDNDLCSLRELRIHGFANHQIAPFVSSLKSISTTLTDLLLSMQHDYVLPMADILMACPNLVSLTMKQPSNVDLSALPMTTTWSKMTTLSVSDATDDITTDHVVEIWKRLPSLKELSLHPCSDIQSAFVVSDYCASMRKIGLYMSSRHTKLTYLDQGHQFKGHGITDLSFHGGSPTSISYHDICNLLMRYCRTLDFLEWGMDLHIQNDDIYSICYPQLKKLVISCIGCGWWLPASAPLLEEFDISSHAIETTDKVLETIPPKLQKLTMGIDTLSLHDKTPITQYLSRIAQHCHLTHFTVYLHSDDLVREILDAICRLNQLEHLAILYTDHWEEDEMEEFFDQLVKGCPRLTRLELKADAPPSLYSMNALKQLKQLKEFTFSIGWCDNGPPFLDTVQALSQVKRMRIYPRIAEDMQTISHLRQQRPDMKIILDERFRQF